MGQVTGDGGSAGALGLPSQRRPLHRPHCSSESGVRLSLGSSSISSKLQSRGHEEPKEQESFAGGGRLAAHQPHQPDSRCGPSGEQAELPFNNRSSETSSNLPYVIQHRQDLNPELLILRTGCDPVPWKVLPNASPFPIPSCQAVISRVKARPAGVGTRHGELGFVVQRHLEMRGEERNTERQRDRLREQSSFWAEDTVQEV